MKENPATEYLLLGVLMTGSKHGYDIMQFLNSSLESTWHLSSSQLYSVLKRLEQKEYLKSIIETQDTRPSRRIFTVTAGGRQHFRDWLTKPVEHGRDFRIEFFGKLFFINHLGLKGGPRLIEAQITRFQKLRLKIEKRKKVEKEAFNKLILEFKINTLGNRIKWLSRQAKPFFKKRQSNSFARSGH